MTPSSLRLHIRLTGLPQWPEGPLAVGLQEGKQGFLRGEPDGSEVAFDVEITVKPGRDGAPDFSGPFVHGPRGERFVYVSWAVERGATRHVFRRLKLYLGPLKRAHWEQPGLTWADVEGGVVALEIPARMADGTPACGTARAPWRSAPR
ncbi:MAG: DUF5990 family protein [Myxococcota bacterium]